MERILIENQTYDAERALYNLTHGDVRHCTFAGPADGESALKEARDVHVDDCHFALRYPLWHAEEFTLSHSTLTDTCRAPLWYAKNGKLSDCHVEGVKCLRECDHITLTGCTIVSPEFGWKCRDITVQNTELTSEYLFWECKNLIIDKLTMHGKYSFQYVENATLTHCDLQTKDAFWHAKNVRVEDSIVSGEYLGWYSEGLTLVRCHITGTQPLCYCKNLTLIDCTMDGTDLSFEYSDVEATVKGHIDSVKNPRSGHITADSIGEVIREGSIMEEDCVVETRGKK